ncbi:MAG: hypothetical protein WC959_10425 [Kiritimatiellales bacterium]
MSTFDDTIENFPAPPFESLDRAVPLCSMDALKKHGLLELDYIQERLPEIISGRQYIYLQQEPEWLVVILRFVRRRYIRDGEWIIDDHWKIDDLRDAAGSFARINRNKLRNACAKRQIPKNK